MNETLKTKVVGSRRNTFREKLLKRKAENDIFSESQKKPILDPITHITQSETFIEEPGGSPQGLSCKLDQIP